MRALMGLLKDRHGTYYARHKVPERLQQAVAQVRADGKAKQVWLKQSLGTKVLSEANRRAKPVQMRFDQIIAQAEELLKAHPVRTSLSDTEIKRMAEFSYAQALWAHDMFVREAPEEEADQRRLAIELGDPSDGGEPASKFGLSNGQMLDVADNAPRILEAAEAALGRGDIQHAAHKTEDALEAFHIKLDPECGDFRKLGLEILRAHVRALRAMGARHKGEPVETPPLVRPAVINSSGETLGAALEGWKKERSPSRGVNLRSPNYRLNLLSSCDRVRIFIG
jgi:hypothetical protein